MFYLLPYLAIAPLAAGAVYALRAERSGFRRAALLCEAAAAAGLAVSALALVVLLVSGTGTSLILGYRGFGFSSRIDALSIVMMLLVAAVGWVVLRFSRIYLDGENGQGRFTGWMSLTIVAALLLVTAGNLLQLVAAWICTSLCLQRLLLFYPDRFHARRAARQKFLTARLADGALVTAALLLGATFGTGDIAEILAAAAGSSETSAASAWICGLLAFAAILKSAQFPAHGWLTEVMETPTPVSALLHAGLINAGGFLLIRFADVMLQSPGVLALLAVIGGFTAIFGGLVMLTQPAVKTSLAWSTIAQMGFMIFQCGLALFPLALLHIVAHSLYKAHAFLCSGAAVENVAAIRRPGPIAAPSVGSVSRAFVVSLGIYLLVGLVFGLDDRSPQAIALGGILIFGIAYLLAQGFADAAPVALMRRTVIYAGIASISYFALQSAAFRITAGELPPTPAPGPLEWALIALSLISFGAVAFAQSMFPLWSNHPAARDIRIHLSNGLYAKAIVDRLLGNWSCGRAATIKREYPAHD